MKAEIYVGDCIEMMRAIPDDSADCCVTSPPYWGLRDYGHNGQIGLESTPDGYVAKMVDVFREVRRVLRDDGTLWLNLGDSYAAGGMSNLKPKDLVGIPWRVAFALQADGWWLRQDIIWHKPSPMPESVTDRCTKAHEYVFLLSKSARYYYDLESIREDAKPWNKGAMSAPKCGPNRVHGTTEQTEKVYAEIKGANARSVWTIATQPFEGAHFATMPRDLAERCVLAGSRAGGVVLDPFAGAGTTGLVALRAGRRFVGCELNPEYADLARTRILSDAPMFYEVTVR